MRISVEFLVFVGAASLSAKNDATTLAFQSGRGRPLNRRASRSAALDARQRFVVRKLPVITFPLRKYRKEATSTVLMMDKQGSSLSFEYCTGCRWALRSFWMAQELLTTFKDEPALAAITLIPSRPPAPGGQFLVQLHDSLIGKSMTLWDRRERGRFPELKELKQLVRDRVDPSLSLGHSDSDARKAEVTKTTEVPTDDGEWSEESESPAGIPARPSIFSPSISISYCVGCRWLLRAAWFGQEIVSTFEDKVHSVTLIPSRPPAQGGSFIITVDEFVVWDRSEKGRFPNITELKQLIRDQIDPSRDLGHGDHKPLDSDMMDESEAEEARRFFGVQ